MFCCWHRLDLWKISSYTWRERDSLSSFHRLYNTDVGLGLKASLSQERSFVPVQGFWLDIWKRLSRSPPRCRSFPWWPVFRLWCGRFSFLFRLWREVWKCVTAEFRTRLLRISPSLDCWWFRKDSCWVSFSWTSLPLHWSVQSHTAPPWSHCRTKAGCSRCILELHQWVCHSSSRFWSWTGSPWPTLHTFVNFQCGTIASCCSFGWAGTWHRWFTKAQSWSSSEGLS